MDEIIDLTFSSDLNLALAKLKKAKNAYIIFTFDSSDIAIRREISIFKHIFDDRYNIRKISFCVRSLCSHNSDLLTQVLIPYLENRNPARRLVLAVENFTSFGILSNFYSENSRIDRLGYHSTFIVQPAGNEISALIFTNTYVSEIELGASIVRISDLSRALKYNRNVFFVSVDARGRNALTDQQLADSRKYKLQRKKCLINRLDLQEDFKKIIKKYLK